MRVAAWQSALVVAALVGACATTPPPPEPIEEFPPPAATPSTPEPAPLVESPPLEPVEPSLPAQTPAPSVTPTPAPPVLVPPPAPAPAPTPPTIIESPEDAQLVGLLGDLARYSALGNDEVRREVTLATQALSRTRSDANRVRLAVLYTLVRSNAQDDQRALQLLDNVAKSGNGVTSIKNLAAVLQAQVTERQRAVREEQQKSEQAVRKLDQMLELERALLRDRVRSGGGGGGGGGGGSAGH